ncbi:peptidoglycan recognition protein family protein [Spirillospora sp. CA-294931]|uniref:peptidoglycan recognition protein family protein n=1 Tax=Spirillospora sp. CA-294931 TaxID=3240042 RepID=UPI003D902A8A
MSPASHVHRRNLLKGAAVVAGGVALGLPRPALAQDAPPVHDRAAWGARPPKSAAEVLDRAPDHVVVHHTASPNTADYSLEHAFALSRSIQSHHMDTNGWADTGQQLTISRGGFLMEGRNRSLRAIGAGDHVVGAHVANENSHLVGIENEGLYMTEGPTDALWARLVETCAWLCGTYGLDPRVRIVGHRDYNNTACPGDRLYAMLPQLRDEVAGRLGLAPARRMPEPRVPSGLPGPRFRFDHGPVLGRGERRP